MELLLTIGLLLGSFILGALPLTGWVVKQLAKKDLSNIGTGNVSVSAAFSQGGVKAGIAAVLIEIFRGIIPVLAAKLLFPDISALQLVSLIILVTGRYLITNGGGVTNVTWGFLVYSPFVAISTAITGLLIWAIGQKIAPHHRTPARLRAARWGALSAVFWVGVWCSGTEEPFRFLELLAATGLAIEVVLINKRQADDLGLYMKQEVLSLSRPLEPEKYGEKAARLSQLKRAGFSVPTGWVVACQTEQTLANSHRKRSVLDPSSTLKTEVLDPPQPPLKRGELDPSFLKVERLPIAFSADQFPLIVRSSAVGEDSDTNSAAGQYQTIGPVMTEEELWQAVAHCRASYWSAEAISYRRQRQIPDQGMAVLIQPYINSLVAGVMFSRNPLDGGAEVVIEALPRGAATVVGGQETPVHLEVSFNQDTLAASDLKQLESQHLLSREVVEHLVKVAQEIEAFYHGLPQDIEWCWDGETVWILQSRPITNLRPIWTRTIAAEVIPGTIPPLTWSINRPLTCGVWGQIFTIVLGEKAKGLDFKETATLFNSHAYFNATLLGEIFRMMGLPEQGLEFLLRGQKMGKPAVKKILPSLPGLVRLMGREMALIKEFKRDRIHLFNPALEQLDRECSDLSFLPKSLSLPDLLNRTERILEVLKPITYYNIISPIGLAIRRAIFKVPDEWLPMESSPEVASIQHLKKLAHNLREATQINNPSLDELESVFNQSLALQNQFQKWLVTYGYLSEVGTDIAVSTWVEHPKTFKTMLIKMASQPEGMSDRHQDISLGTWDKIRQNQCYERAKIKGEIAEIYGQLLAHLRWTFLEMEIRGLELGYLQNAGDIFYLEFSDIQVWIRQGWNPSLTEKIEQRRKQFECDRNSSVPPVIYGNLVPKPRYSPQTITQDSILTGIPASVGCVEGIVKVCRSITEFTDTEEKPILVVPYTDAGWAPLLIHAKAIIAEVGGQLSHGAIIAREYQIPAVMNITEATSRLKNGQKIRVDGYQGTVEILEC